jgi:hypothetical protein
MEGIMTGLIRIIRLMPGRERVLGSCGRKVMVDFLGPVSPPHLTWTRDSIRDLP